MPASTLGVSKSTGSITLIDMAGKKSTVSVEVSGTITGAQMTALHAAVGACSNAGTIQSKLAAVIGCSVYDAEVFDEAFAAVDDKLVLVFEEQGTLAARIVRIPAPDASLFNAGYRVAKTTTESAALLALVDALIAIFETEAGTDWKYVRGYREGFASAAPSILLATEPGAASSPPQLPASEPA